MRSNWNPTRRNRNIGTSKSGYGFTNKMVIPSRRNDTRAFWEKLIGYHEVSIKINEHEITFLIEATKGNYKYHCTVEDISHLLSFIPEDDISIIDLIIFRQPKAKEEIISPAWGRLDFNVNIGKYYGPAIIIEAVDINKHFNWSNSLDPYGQKELERLREDGHKITHSKRKYTIEMSSEAVRATQLYRTLIHEIGHWVQYADITLSEENKRNDKVYNEYSEIPRVQKEVFADRYVDKIKEKFTNKKIIPFHKRHCLFESKELSSYFE